VSLDADRLVTALARLERNLVDQGWPSVRGLQPGLSESDVRERLVDAGFEPPAMSNLTIGYRVRRVAGSPPGLVY
jgi:hypothetical protein